MKEMKNLEEIRGFAKTFFQGMTKEGIIEIINTLEKFVKGGLIPFITKPKTPARKAKEIMNKICIKDTLIFIEEARKIYQ